MFIIMFIILLYNNSQQLSLLNVSYIKTLSPARRLMKMPDCQKLVVSMDTILSNSVTVDGCLGNG